MNDWIVAPVVIPAIAAALLVVARRDALALQRAVSIGSTGALLVLSGGLVTTVGDQPLAYLIGNWPAPYGIVLVVDRLSAMMLLLTATLAALALAHAIGGWDRRGSGALSFHALFQLQLMGLNGAFLTADIFNLFVFFEVLLIASIGLLVHGGGAERARNALRYTVLNLVGSSFLLLGVALLYGVAGTLNIADLAIEIVQLDADRVRLAQVAGALLLIGFGIKAAVFPLYFWLPGSYAAAAAPVAALFAIMTKVGVYAMIRLLLLIYTDAPPGVLDGLIWIGLVTLAVGTAGVLGSRDLGGFTAYLTIVSVGMMLTGVGLLTPAGTSAALFYLVQSTLLLAGLFLLRELVASQRAHAADRFVRGPPLVHAALLPGLFWLLAAAAVGLPPLTGFVGKLMLLRSAVDDPYGAVVWVLVLGTSLLLLLGAARAGSRLFWDTRGRTAQVAEPTGSPPVAPAAIAVALQFVLVIGAGPLQRYTEAAASQLHAGTDYRTAVLESRALPQRGVPEQLTRELRR